MAPSKKKKKPAAKPTIEETPVVEEPVVETNKQVKPTLTLRDRLANRHGFPPTPPVRK